MLFDLENDPEELVDLGAKPTYANVRQRLTDAVFDWALRERQRVTITDAQVASHTDKATVDQGVLIGFWDEEELREFQAKTQH